MCCYDPVKKSSCCSEQIGISPVTILQAATGAEPGKATSQSGAESAAAGISAASTSQTAQTRVPDGKTDAATAELQTTNSQTARASSSQPETTRFQTSISTKETTAQSAIPKPGTASVSMAEPKTTGGLGQTGITGAGVSGNGTSTLKAELETASGRPSTTAVPASGPMATSPSARQNTGTTTCKCPTGGTPIGEHPQPKI